MLGVLGWVSSLMLQKQVCDRFCLFEYDLSHEYHKVQWHLFDHSSNGA